MTNDDWQIELTPYREAIEAGLRDALTCPFPALTAYYDMMHYHLGWVDAAGQSVQTPPGKRLRPLLCLLACQAAGGDWPLALPVAVAVELLHNFSLIHDDIEDGDARRRHRPTVWKVWGMPHAINAGDGMFALAHQALQRLATEDGIPADVLVALYRRFDAACLALCHGQFLDMCFETRLGVTVDDYLHMVQSKTASLFATALEMGAFLGVDGPATAAHYRAFGVELGLAFQIQDDVLGIWGDPAVTGKPVANDLRQRKKTWPVLYALEHAAGPSHEVLWSFYQQPQSGEADVARVLDILNDLGVRAQAEALVAKYHDRALTVLDPATGREPAWGWLRALAQTLVGRKR
jgi:geranylgeranyl diphosphate synthase type I